MQRKQQATPEGWVQDANGEIVTDAFALKKGGALRPLGSDADGSSHKGYCLGSIVDIFSGVLSGAGYGPWAPPFVSFLSPPPNAPGQGLGHFFGVMRVDAFGPAEEFLNHMDTWIKRFREATPIAADKPVQIPGDPERISRTLREKEGIPLLEAVVEDLTQLAEKFGVPSLELA